MRILSYCKRLAMGSILLGSALTLGSCGDEYSYFTVTMNFEGLNTTTLATIGTCSLKIESGGKEVDSFPLGQTDETVDGKTYKRGCATKETGTYVGKLNYSSLRPSGTVLKFTLTGKTDEGANSKDVAQGSAEGTANPGPNEIKVDVKATKI